VRVPVSIFFSIHAQDNIKSRYAQKNLIVNLYEQPKEKPRAKQKSGGFLGKSSWKVYIFLPSLKSYPKYILENSRAHILFLGLDRTILKVVQSGTGTVG